MIYTEYVIFVTLLPVAEDFVFMRNAWSLNKNQQIFHSYAKKDDRMCFSLLFNDGIP